MLGPPACAFCGHGKGHLQGTLGELVGPLKEGVALAQQVFVHRNCAIWSGEVNVLSSPCQLPLDLVASLIRVAVVADALHAGPQTPLHASSAGRLCGHASAYAHEWAWPPGSQNSCPCLDCWFSVHVLGKATQPKPLQHFRDGCTAMLHADIPRRCAPAKCHARCAARAPNKVSRGLRHDAGVPEKASTGNMLTDKEGI